MNRTLKQLTENRLRNMVHNTVSRVLREHIDEGGHLYGHHDDGTPFTNSEETYHGIPGTVFISHGGWADPEIWYDGEELNANVVEDTLWSMYEEECEEDGREPSEEEYDNLPTEWFQERLDDIMFGMFSPEG